MAPKMKKPLTAKAKATLKAAKVAAKQAAIEAGEVPASPAKPKISVFKKKVLASLGDKTIAEAAEDFKKHWHFKNAQTQGFSHSLHSQSCANLALSRACTFSTTCSGNLAVI